MELKHFCKDLTLTKWQKIFFTLAENGRQKICIYQKKAVPL